MRIRLSGTDTECAAAVAALAAGFVLREVSGFYPNRGASALGRLYVDAVPLSSAPAADGQFDARSGSVHQRIGSVEAGATVVGAVVGDRRPPRRPGPLPRNRDSEGPAGGEAS